jgi:uncharacterized membrane protein
MLECRYLLVEGAEMDKQHKRVFEIDLVRGFVLILVVLYHLIYDLYEFLQLESLSFICSLELDLFLRLPFLGVLTLISGISCSFSRNNLRRGGRMLLYSAGFTVVTYLLEFRFWPGIGVIWFNIIHVVSVSTLIYALLVWLYGKIDRDSRWQENHNLTVILVILGSYIAYLGQVVSTLPFQTRPGSWWLLPLGFPPPGLVMMDYLPLIPWLGFFLIGAAVGRLSYPDKVTRFPGASPRLLTWLSPIIWIGRHSLLVYILHQPLSLLLVLGLKALFGL